MDELDQPERAEASTKRVGKRREQQRAVETRRAILEAALNEFAERGFEGASVRRIGERAGVEFTLITYHFGNKGALWRATCEHAFAQLQADWEADMPDRSKLPPAEALRRELRSLFRFTVDYTSFHQFMLRENQGPSPRLQWLVETILSKSLRRILPLIEAAQADGLLIEGDPALVYYMLVGMTSVLSSLNGEMAATIGFSLKDPAAVERYWSLLERVVFK